MGQLNGIETARIIRQECKKKNMVKLVTIGYSSLLMNEDDCQNFDILLNKPCQMNELIEMIKKFEYITLNSESIKEEEQDMSKSES